MLEIYMDFGYGNKSDFNVIEKETVIVIEC